MNKNKKIYSLYKGETNFTDGTIDEIANYLGTSRKTVHYYKSPSYISRTNEEKAWRLVELEGDV